MDKPGGGGTLLREVINPRTTCTTFLYPPRFTTLPDKRSRISFFATSLAKRKTDSISLGRPFLNGRVTDEGAGKHECYRPSVIELGNRVYKLPRDFVSRSFQPVSSEDMRRVLSVFSLLRKSCWFLLSRSSFFFFFLIFTTPLKSMRNFCGIIADIQYLSTIFVYYDFNIPFFLIFIILLSRLFSFLAFEYFN